jgi:hypothetical protein
MVEAILAERAAGPRAYRNMLVFLAPDKARLEELREAARLFLAWDSIVQDHEELNLDAQQRRHAETQRRNFEEAVAQRIGETFIWLLTPRQEAANPEVVWEQSRVTGSDPIPIRVSRKLQQEESLISEYSGTRLRIDLNHVPLWRGDHVSTQQLWSDYAQYLYLPRLRDQSVLTDAIGRGVSSITWEQDAFAYADAFDEASERYSGLVAGSHPTVVVDSRSVVVKPDVARAQLEADGKTEPGDTKDAGDDVSVDGTDTAPTDESVVRRFYGVKSIDPQRASRDVDQIATELLSHLVALVGADVDVRLEINVDVPEGVPDDVVRTVTENASALKFDQHGFEEA